MPPRLQDRILNNILFILKIFSFSEQTDFMIFRMMLKIFDLSNRQQVIGKHASLKQSVCRQCFNLCDNRTNAGKLECFGSSDTKNGHQKIQQKLATQIGTATFSAVFPWHAFYRQTDAETTDVLGNLRNK